MASELFNNMNTDGTLNSPLYPTDFGLAQPTLITRVFLYFFNGGIGAITPLTAGTLSVTLRDLWTGASFGPFTPAFSPGHGGVPNANVTRLTLEAQIKPLRGIRRRGYEYFWVKSSTSGPG
jgi:hypothetical protein